MCPKSGKVSYKTRGEAWQAHRHQRHRKARIYECACGCYHVTSHVLQKVKTKSKN